MIRAIEGPLAVSPESWTLVFDRAASSRWLGFLAFGRLKHVRAFAYVPFLHVWVFYDPHFWGTEIVIAADGEAANRMIGKWITNADLLRMPRSSSGLPRFGFWCVPMIKSLIGFRSWALRPDALYRACVRSGATPFGAVRCAPTAPGAIPEDGCARV